MKRFFFSTSVLFFYLVFFSLPRHCFATSLDMASIRTIPVQAGGRVKPLDTFARESVRWVTGKTRFQGRDPVDVLCSWMAESDRWKTAPVVEIHHLALKDRLKLKRDQRWFTMEQLMPIVPDHPWIVQALERQRRDEKLNAEEQEGASVYHKMVFVAQISSGEALPLVPHPSDAAGPWRSVHGAVEWKEAGYTQRWLGELEKGWHEWLEAYRRQDGAEWERASTHLRKLLANPESSHWWTSGRPFPYLGVEVQYNTLHPFRWAWILYGIAFLFLLMGRKWGSAWSTLGFVGYVGGIGLHAYGILLRCLIAGRPPVTNMYESVIWVTFGTSVFGLVFELIYRRARYFVFGALAAGVVGLVLADNLPNVLNPNLDPLVPVLRDNFWLTIHVLTITLSYAAYTLAMCVAHMNLWNTVWRPVSPEQSAEQGQFLYRILQVGVLLLAAGTILGGVWANQSWGRFWGWDPKETWALTALLGYLVILHGRRAGWWKEFGTAVGSIVAYQGVLMAWYGVNFVLGQGLHSYGFGTGGVSYVMMYVVLELLFVGWAVWKQRNLELRVKS